MKLKMASPCAQSWEEMKGDDRVRFCGACQKKVLNLSSLSEREIEKLLGPGRKLPCVRFFERADGTVMTADCPVGRRRRWLRRIAGAAAVVLTWVLAVSLRGSDSPSPAAPEWFQQVLAWLNPKPVPPVSPVRLVVGEPAPPSPPRGGGSRSLQAP